MKNKLIITLITVCVLSGFTQVKANANTVEGNTNKSIENLSSKGEISKTFTVISTDKFNRAGDKVKLTLSNSRKTLSCYNMRTGITYTCNPYSSYVGYGYANKKGDVGCLQGLFAYMKADLLVDGLFGPKTHNSILQFQRSSNGYLSVDGIAGPKTFDWAIFKVFDGGGTPIAE